MKTPETHKWKPSGTFVSGVWRKRDGKQSLLRRSPVVALVPCGTPTRQEGEGEAGLSQHLGTRPLPSEVGSPGWGGAHSTKDHRLDPPSTFCGGAPTPAQMPGRDLCSVKMDPSGPRHFTQQLLPTTDTEQPPCSPTAAAANRQARVIESPLAPRILEACPPPRAGGWNRTASRGPLPEAGREEADVVHGPRQLQWDTCVQAAPLPEPGLWPLTMSPASWIRTAMRQAGRAPATVLICRPENRPGGKRSCPTVSPSAHWGSSASGLWAVPWTSGIRPQEGCSTHEQTLWKSVHVQQEATGRGCQGWMGPWALE